MTTYQDIMDKKLRVREANRKYREKHPEVIRKAIKKYRTQNREKYLDTFHNYRKSHRLDIWKNHRRWYYKDKLKKICSLIQFLLNIDPNNHYGWMNFSFRQVIYCKSVILGTYYLNGR